MITFPGISSLPELTMRTSQTFAAQSPESQPGGPSFLDTLGRLASETATAVREGEAATAAGMQGALPLQSVVEKVMAAERTLQAALAVRDKAVSSYLEISRMQI
ncbi:MAG: flagellar hook-basal body complex protein FliE [Aestuariivirga sp.]|uniref:flagellar hook-basal body complex protein FliE n=1 Tax=Aestuariivirga sp. TaxID=2650926 RepID=UPI0038D1C41E